MARTSPASFAVLLLDGDSSYATAVARGLARAGVEVHVCAGDRSAPIRASRYVRSFQLWDASDDDDAFVARLQKATERTGARVALADP